MAQMMRTGAKVEVQEESSVVYSSEIKASINEIQNLLAKFKKGGLTDMQETAIDEKQVK